MATKKESIPTNVNNNTNNNSVNVKVDVYTPKRVSAKKKEKEKPNWLLKALVVALIGFVLSIITYYIKTKNGSHNPAVIENGAPAIDGVKQTN